MENMKFRFNTIVLLSMLVYALKYSQDVAFFVNKLYTLCDRKIENRTIVHENQRQELVVFNTLT
jgi:hypothetical protein